MGFTRFREESEFGRYRCWQWRPEPDDPLLRFVKAIWFVDGRFKFTRERILPSGCVTLMINTGPVQALLWPGQGDGSYEIEAFRHSWVAGLQQRALMISSTEGSRLYGIRLTFPGACALLGLPLDEIASRVIDAESLNLRGIGALRNALADMDGEPDSLDRIYDFLAAGILGAGTFNGNVAFALDRLKRTGGRAAVGSIAAELGISRKGLRGQFLRQAGLTPKRIARLIRFRRAREFLAAGQSIAETAYRCGCADQAHLTRDFRSIAGVSPTTYIACRTPDGSSVVDCWDQPPDPRRPVTNLQDRYSANA